MEIPKAEILEEPTVLQKFEEQVRTIPDHDAITAAGKSLTYKDLNYRSELIAHKIKSAGNSNPYVAILLPQGIEFISSVYGTWKSEHAAVPVDTGNSNAQIGYILEELKNPLLITSKKYFHKVENYTNLLTVGDNDLSGTDLEIESSKAKVITITELALEPTSKVEGETKNGAKTAFIIFTSGSTGKPKGVIIPHRVISRVTNTPWSLREISTTTKSLAYSSPAFILSFGEYITILARGGTVFVPESEYRHNLDKLYEFITQNGITIMSMPTSAAIKMIDRSMPSLRWFRIGGEKLTVPIQGIKTFRIMYVYGSTEAFGIAFRVEFNGIEIPNNGPPAPGVQVWFLDENLKPVEDGTEGEICVASGCIADGYLNHPELTRNRFLENPFKPGQKLYRTGDLGYLNSNGELVVTGRSDFQVKIMGHRVELGQVEFALTQHPNIKQAAAIIVDKNDNKSITAFCVPEVSPLPDINTLRKFLENHLPRYALPAQVVALEQIPMTTSGKYDRQALKRIEVIKVIEPIITETEKQVSKLWSEVLKIPVSEIGRTDSFFTLGGSSLSLALIATKLQGPPWFLNVRLKNLFKVPQLHEFAAMIDRFQKTGYLPESVKSEPDFDNDSLLDSDFPKVKGELSKPAHKALLTGVTGYVGANFLQTLLARKPDLVIFCIIRARDNEQAQGRLERTLSKYGIPKSVLNSNVICWSGDISKNNFGLSGGDYTNLCDNIDVVYHFAAEVHFLKSYEELRASNVGGTRKILNFCIQSKLKFLNYISTFSVIGRNGSGETIFEKRDPIFRINEKDSQDMGYSQSKRIAEKLVWAAIDQGLPAIVYRLGEIGCHSKNNVVNKDDFLARLFLTSHETGFYPIIPKKLPYGSVDFTCDAILYISGQNTMIGDCFHVFETQLSYIQGFKAMNNVIGLEYPEWVKKITEIIETNLGTEKQEEFSILLQLMHNTAGSTVLDNTFSNSNVTLALSGDNDVCFNPNQNWNRYLAVLLN